MSTSTSSSLNSDKNMNQPSDGRTSTERTTAARQFATTLQPGSKSPATNADQSAQVASDGNGSENVTGIPVINVKPVDRRTIEGSTPGDFRSKPGDTVVLPDNPGPREPRGQSTVMSSKLQATATPEPVTGLSEASQS